METMDKVKTLCERRGYIFPGSDIYGGLQNTYDYGPLGVELLNNIKKLWWKKFIQQNPQNVGLDASILMNSRVWQASGHVGNFSDPMIDCKSCKARHRADKLIEDKVDMIADGLSFDAMSQLIAEHNIVCPTCGAHDYTAIRQFNLMFKTQQGVTEDSSNAIYMRPETAQGIFVNFKAVQRSLRKKLPFGIGQIGKSFRNEITPGNFTFRTREFEQMELEFFCKPGEDMAWFKHWESFCLNWLLNIGIKPENVRLREHSKEELSHYSSATSDIEYKFPFGWGELWGIANRGDYDLRQHMEHSGVDLRYIDPITNEKYLPYCIEPSLGAGRVTLAVLADAYSEEKLPDGSERIVMKLHPAIAPIKVAVFGLRKEHNARAEGIYHILSEEFTCDIDDSSVQIGKKYRRQDEVGTPYCVTYDSQSEEDNTVTVRDRDTMTQERVLISDLVSYIQEKIKLQKK
jgi:glycyl-tRNA synthetase